MADELRRAIRELGRWGARRSLLITVAEDRGLAHKEGFPSTTAWLVALSGEPAPVCRSQLAVAEALEQMPVTREAFAAGELPESRVRVLAQAQALAPAQFARDESRLVAQAATVPSKQLPAVLAAWKRATDPQAAEAETERLHSLRALHVSAAWSGMVHLSGDLDPEGGLAVLTALRSLTEPAALDPQDSRTPAQCRADALVEICQRFLAGGNGGSHRPQVAVTIPWHTLHTGQGLVDTEAGAISGKAARQLTCDATLTRVILDGDTIPIEVGRATRIIPPALRKALDLRDGHCTHPGCDLPARYCDAHHITHWAQGGKTQLDNLVLLCRRHHRQAHHHQPYHRRE